MGKVCSLLWEVCFKVEGKKATNVVKQVEIFGVHEMKRAPCSPSVRCLKNECKVFDAQTQKNKGAQVLGELETCSKLSRLEIGLKWHVEEVWGVKTCLGVSKVAFENP